MRFSIPDAGGSGASASGANGGGEGDEKIVTPFDNLPWDELSDEDRPKFEQAKKDFVATLQSKKQIEADLLREKGLSKQFQSEADKLKAERSKLALDQRQNQPDPVLEALTEELLTAGYDQTQATTLAPVFAKMFNRVGDIQAKKIGEGLAPLGATVLAGQAQTAFQTAVANDPLGFFQKPEIQQKAWEFVQERIKLGEQTTPEIILNVAKMLWADDIVAERAAGREVSIPTGPRSLQPTGMNSQFTFPGAAGITPTAQPSGGGGNSAKTMLDADTRTALAQTFKSMAGDSGIYPRELKADILTPRRRS